MFLSGVAHGKILSAIASVTSDRSTRSPNNLIDKVKKLFSRILGSGSLNTKSPEAQVFDHDRGILVRAQTTPNIGFMHHVGA